MYRPNFRLRPCAGVLFDVDGTLVDDSLHRAKHNYVLGQYYDVRRLPNLLITEQEWAEIGGLSDVDAYDHISTKARQLGLTNFPECETYLKAANNYFTANIKATRIRPGAADLIQAAESLSLPLGIATNADRKETLRKLEVTRLRSHFCFVGCLDGRHEPKPAPDLYLAGIAAIRRIHGNPAVQPDQIIAIEDTLTGAKAALTAGCQTFLWLKPGQQFPEYRSISPRLIVIADVREIIDRLTRSRSRVRSNFRAYKSFG